MSKHAPHPPGRKIEQALLSLPSGTTLFHTGPSLDKGPLPSVFYFALSGADSLGLEPYNQFVQFLADFPIRLFSLTLPFHEKPELPTRAMGLWAQAISEGRDIFRPFLDQITESLAYLKQHDLLITDKIGVAGLSRGGLIASHAAAENPEIHHLVEFAPVTDLAQVSEFQEVKDHPLLARYSAYHLCSSLANRNLCIYIGNRDQKVGTKSAFHFMEKLVDAAAEQKIRTPQIEMVITPSIGYKGHGTSPESFQSGALRMARYLSTNPL